MSSSSGRAEFNRLNYEQELQETRRVLAGPTLGARQEAELAELERLVRNHPGRAREILDEVEGRNP